MDSHSRHWDRLPVAVQDRVRAKREELQSAWEAGQRPDPAAFLADEVSQDERSALLFELLCVDLQHRAAGDETPDRDAYRSRFADDVAVVDSVFDLLQTGRLTTVGPGAGDTIDEHVVEPTVISVETAAETQLEIPTNLAEIETAHESAGATTIDEGLMPVQRPPVSKPPTAGPSFPTGPKTLGDYELLETLGQGGMGTVFRARQRSVNRIVALKIIRPDRLAQMNSTIRNQAIDRFRAEAEAAAKINHDHLVTVYEVGFVDEVHYLAMQFVEGRSLSDLLRDGPAENQAAAEWLAPVCRAVHAVHEHGILHRDLKPANILIEDESGKTLVADFGLAKLADSDQQMTQSGEAMGTPPYMSPEQFQDAATVSRSTDIYALGATLYHMLSGRPPFQAASTMKTMRQVLEAEPVPLRQLNPAVHRDLETICMKCLQKEASPRYETAAELADELERFLEGRPILARPVSALERAVRWCRRNPLPASLAGATVVATAVAVVSLAVSNVRTEEARQRSEASFQDAMGAVNDLFTKVSEERLLNEPGLQSVRRDLLLRAKDYYERFLKRRANDETVEDELAMAQFRLGFIAEQTDDPQAAERWYVRARQRQEKLLEQQPESWQRRRQLSTTWNALGRLRSGSDADRAVAAFEKAQEIREQLAESAGTDEERLEATRLLANTRMNRGILKRRAEDLKTAHSQFRQAQQERQRALKKKPKHRKLRRDLAKGHFNLANLAIDQDDLESHRNHLDEAIRIFGELLEEQSRDLEDRYNLALCLRMRGDTWAALTGSHNEAVSRAIESYASARIQVRQLVDRNPDVDRYARELADLLLNLAEFEAQQMRWPVVSELLDEAAAVVAGLLKKAPDAPELLDLQKTIQQLIDYTRRMNQQGRLQPAAPVLVTGY